MSKRSLALLLEDIWDAIQKIERYTAGLSIESFRKDERTTDAVVRTLEIIGEAASRLPSDFKEDHNDIEWGKIVGLRHRIGKQRGRVLTFDKTAWGGCCGSDQDKPVKLEEYVLTICPDSGLKGAILEFEMTSPRNGL